MRPITCLFLFLFFLSGEYALAQEQIARKVVVTASRIEEKPDDVPQSMLVIDSEILDRNQYANLADLLQNYGLAVTSYGPSQTSSQISIRGFTSALSDPLDSNVQVLVNGTPIATVNLAMIPTDGIERIEILRGPSSVQYGSSAMGGVINIIPKKGGREFRLSAEGGGGTWNAWRALGSLSGEIKNFDFSGAVTWNRQGSNYTTGDGDLYQDTQAKSKMNYLLNFGYNFNEENRLGATILGANDWGLGQNQSLSDEQRYNGLDFSAKRVNSSFDASYDGGYAEAGLAWKLKYYNSYDLYESLYPVDNPMFMSDSSIEVVQRGFQGQASWSRKFLTLTGGVDYGHNRYYSGFSPAYTQNDTGIFGLAKLNFLDDLIVISAGARYDNYQFTVEDDSDYMNNTSLSGGIAINPLDWLTFRTNWAESFKMPSGLYVVGYSGTYGVEPNPDLDPEKGYGWDGGVDIHFKGIRLGLTYFSTIYDNKFVSAYLPSGKSKYYNADGSTWINGLEGEVRIDMGALLDWSFTLEPYFYFTRLLNYTDPQGSKIYNTRDLVASWGINYNHEEIGLNADLRFNYLGYQKEMIYSENYERLPDKRTGGKTVVDLFVSQRICDFKSGGKLTVKGEIRNLTNENYAYRYDFPMPGRSFYVGLRYDY